MSRIKRRSSKRKLLLGNNSSASDPAELSDMAESETRKNLARLLESEQRAQQRVQKLEAREKLLAESCRQLKHQGTDVGTSGRSRRKGGSRRPNEIMSVSMSIRRDNVMLGERIGTGGTGSEVFNCTIDNSWSCVVKQIDSNVCCEEHVDEMRQEIQLMSQLPPHNNLVRYLFHYEFNGLVRLFMMRYSTNLEKIISDRLVHALEEIEEAEEREKEEAGKLLEEAEEAAEATASTEDEDSNYRPRKMSVQFSFDGESDSSSVAAAASELRAPPVKAARSTSSEEQTDQKKKLMRMLSYRISGSDMLASKPLREGDVTVSGFGPGRGRREQLHRMPSYRMNAASVLGKKKSLGEDSAAPSLARRASVAGDSTVLRRAAERAGVPSTKEIRKEVKKEGKKESKKPSKKTSKKESQSKESKKESKKAGRKRSVDVCEDSSDDDDDEYDEVVDEEMFVFEQGDLVAESLLRRAGASAGASAVPQQSTAATAPVSTGVRIASAPATPKPTRAEGSPSKSSFRCAPAPSSGSQSMPTLPPLQVFSIARHVVEPHKYESHLFSHELLLLYALCIAKGIEALHNLDIIYRDLKPENVLVILNNQNEPVKVAIGDFGASMRITPTDRPKATLGTIGYMAPEVLNAQDESEYGLPADIYSFGMLLYEMMMLEHPFADVEHPADMFPLIRNGDVPSLPESNQYKYPGMVELYGQCVSLDPAMRPTASELSALLASQFRERYMGLRENPLAQLMLSSEPVPMAFSPRYRPMRHTVPVSVTQALNFGWSKQHSAAADEDLDALEAYLDAKESFSQKNHDGNLPLHYFVLASKWAEGSTRHEAILDRMLEVCDINARNNHGETALHRCVLRNKSVPLAALIKRGADVNLLTDRGLCALHFAVTHSKPKCLDILLEQKPNAVQDQGLMRSLIQMAQTSPASETMQERLRPYIHPLTDSSDASSENSLSDAL